MDDMSARILEIKDKGSEQELNSFIADNKSFIIGAASRVAGRYISESDDEYSIALIAFSEAINSYDEAKGSFPGLARTIIKRRLIDFIRSESRHRNELSVEPFVMDADLSDEEEVSGLSMEVLHRTAEIGTESNPGTPGFNPHAEEIEAVQQILAPYNFSLFDLSDCSPKAEKTRVHCAAAVNALLDDRELFDSMREKRTLPMKDLVNACKVSKKILDRHRRYIIAAAEILNGDYPLMHEYMSFIRTSLKTKNR
mgnify:CR=1 FL=1